MPLFSVRTVTLHSPYNDQKKKNLYEERITLWMVSSEEEAMQNAVAESWAYEIDCDATGIDFAQCYSLFSEFAISSQGEEIFSLMRESDLEPDDYISAFFDTDFERIRKC